MLTGPLSSPDLVGRKKELGLLVERAVAPPALALIEGEAGVGKTRIVDELLSCGELRDHRRLLGRCHLLREPLPLAPIVEALRSAPLPPDLRPLSPLAGILARFLPEARHGWFTAPPPLGESPTERHLLFLGALELLAQIGPTVLVLEDVHWCDDQTRDFVRFLVPQLPPDLSLVLTYRREDLGLSSQLLSLAAACPRGATFSRVELSPLSQEETRTMASAILGPAQVSPEFARYIHQRTAGLPFAIEEVVRLLCHRPDITAGGRWIDSVPEVHAVPATVRDVVLERVADLALDARVVTDAAAVMGAPATETLLSRIGGLTVAKNAVAVSQALQAGVLVAGPGGYGFRHPLASQAVYEAIPPPTRRLMHLRAARALDVAPRPVAQLAHHYRHAGQGPEWLRYAEAAADLAAERGDDAAAAAFLELAVNSEDSGRAARVRRAFKLARAAARGSARLPGCIGALRRVIDEEDLADGTRGELRLFLGALTERSGHTDEGRQELARCIDELRCRPELAAKAMAWLARPGVVEGQLSDHLGWLDRAMSLLATHDDPRLRIDVLQTRAEVLILVGDPDGDRAAADIPWQANFPGSGQMLAWAAIGLAGLYFHAGQYQQGRRWLDDARGMTREWAGGADPYAGAITTHALLLDWATGQWDGLEERARLHALRCADIPRQSVAAQRIAAHLALTRGDLDRAQSRLDTFFDQARDVGVIPALVFGGACQARIHLNRGDAHAAVAEASVWLRVIAEKGIWVWAAELAPVAVEAMLAADQMADAHDLTARFAAGLTRCHTPLAHSAVEACQAMLAMADGRPDDAHRGWGRALRSYSSLPRPYDAAWAETHLGLCELDGSRPEGTAHLLAALASFGGLGATGDAGRVRQELRQRSIARPHSGGRRAYGNALSPREQEVVRLAGRHLTNAEIAATLGLSSKTIEHHVGAAMRKLGVTSRRAFSDVDIGRSQK